MLLSFELTMPNNNSWNGKWTGADNKYFVVKKHERTELFEPNKPKNFYYNFGDGWGANVKVEVIDSVEAKKRRKVSKGFCGYEWMIDSIIKHGKIKIDDLESA